jgi:hypothetical protein
VCRRCGVEALDMIAAGCGRCTRLGHCDDGRSRISLARLAVSILVESFCMRMYNTTRFLLVKFFSLEVHGQNV